MRSFYTANDPTDFDVGYHNHSVGTSARGHGQFSLATYHAAVPPPPPPSGLIRKPKLKEESFFFSVSTGGVLQ